MATSRTSMAEEEVTYRAQKRFNEYDDGQTNVKKNRLEQNFGKLQIIYKQF